MIFHSLCVGVAPYLFLAIAVENIEPSLAVMLAQCEPLAAMVFGAVFFGEMPTVLSIMGLLITVTALIIISRD